MKKISSLVRKILSEVGRNEMLAWAKPNMPKIIIIIAKIFK